jgi:hypothetical protein
MMQKILTALVAVMLAASFGTVFAGSSTPGGYVTGDQPQQDAPKDCTKNPSDPRCKSGN